MRLLVVISQQKTVHATKWMYTNISRRLLQVVLYSRLHTTTKTTFGYFQKIEQ